MQELEKILEEINKQKRICLEIDNGDEYNAGALDMANSIKYIIRKHTNDDKCAECSRRKWYQQGYEDGKNNNDGWIPVDERLPDESLNSVIGWDEYRERCCFVQYYGGRWALRADREPIKITHWRPLPDHPERSGIE